MSLRYTVQAYFWGKISQVKLLLPFKPMFLQWLAALSIARQYTVSSPALSLIQILSLPPFNSQSSAGPPLPCFTLTHSDWKNSDQTFRHRDQWSPCSPLWVPEERQKDKGTFEILPIYSGLYGWTPRQRECVFAWMRNSRGDGQDHCSFEISSYSSFLSNDRGIGSICIHVLFILKQVSSCSYIV